MRTILQLDRQYRRTGRGKKLVLKSLGHFNIFVFGFQYKHRERNQHDRSIYQGTEIIAFKLGNSVWQTLEFDGVTSCGYC